ncbi:hypothetical protein LOK49_Contig29G00005 [Camellia lanceoleosa]|nr:hypothetical protein LOK49_Contig29G00005 [Camellia lanceoleosa]
MSNIPWFLPKPFASCYTACREQPGCPKGNHRI